MVFPATRPCGRFAGKVPGSFFPAFPWASNIRSSSSWILESDCKHRSRWAESFGAADWAVDRMSHDFHTHPSSGIAASTIAVVRPTLGWAMGLVGY